MKRLPSLSVAFALVCAVVVILTGYTVAQAQGLRSANFIPPASLSSPEVQAGPHASEVVEAGRLNDKMPAFTSSVNASVTLTGTPVLTVTPAALDFGTVYVGVTGTRQLTLTNAGTADLSVTAINPGHADVSVAFTSTLTIVPGARRAMTVTFTPSGAESVSATLTITSNGGIITVPISGVGLLPPIIQVAPTAFVETLAAGSVVTRGLTISNTGGSNLDWSLRLPSVAVLGADYTSAYTSDVVSKLQATGQFNSIAFINVAARTPTLAELQAYDAVLVYRNSSYSFNNVTTLGNILADYVDAGGGVVVMHFALYNGYYIQGRFLSGGYYAIDAANSSSQSASNLTLGTIDAPGHPVVQGVSSFNGGSSSYHSSGALTSGAAVVARYSNAQPLVVEKQLQNGARRRIDLNFFPPSSSVSSYFWDSSTDGARLMANSLRYVARSSYVGVTPISGTVTAGSSAAVSVTLNAANLISGTYRRADLNIRSNDPFTPSVNVPVTLTVIGTPVLTVTPAMFNFGTVYVGVSRTQQMTLTNVGTADLNVTAINPGHADVSVAFTPTLTLVPGARRVMTVTFTPSGGLVSATLAITSNAGVATVPISGTGLLPPSVQVTPTAFVETLAAGSMVTRGLTISNVGGSNLTFTLLEATPVVTAGLMLRTWNSGLAAAWGLAYDGEHGTVWVSSPAPNWGGNRTLYEYTLSGVQTGRSRAYTWNPGYGPADLAFNWNTGKFWALDVATDDCLHEVDPASGVTGRVVCGPWGISQRGVAYDPATDTWYVGGWNENTIYHLNASGALLDSANVGLAIAGLAYNPDSRHLFVQVIYSPGDVYVLDAAQSNYPQIRHFHIGTLNTGAGLEMDCAGNLWAVDQSNQTIIQAGSGERASFLCRQFFAQPVTGTVAAGSSVPVSVTLDARELISGTYRTGIEVRSNDPFTPSINVPVTLTVIGTPVLTVTPAAFNFGTVYVGVSRTLPLTLTNVGTANLDVTAVASSHPDFSVAFSSTLLVPGASRVVTVTFVPSDSGALTETLTITSTGGVVTPPVSGHRLWPPVIQVMPTAFVETLAAGSMVTRGLTISNTGGSDSLFAISTFLGDPELALPLDEPSGATTFRDISGNNHYGTCSGFSCPVGVDGKLNLAAQFDGSDDVIAVTSMPTFTTFSLSLWFKWDDFDSSTIGFLTARGMEDMELHTGGGAGKNGLRFIPAGYPETHVDAANVITTGWNHVVATYDGITATLYVNGMLAASRTIAGSGNNLAADSAPFLMGQRSGGSYPFHGAIDDVRVYNRVLSAPEVQSLAQAGGVLRVDVTPVTGTVVPGSSTAVSVTLDATDLVSGTYRADLIIRSNDPFTPSVVVPVTLTVTGIPSITLAPALLDMGTAFAGYSTTRPITIANPGTAELNVTSITSDNPALTVLNSALRVPARSQRVVQARYAPGTPGVLAATLIVRSDAPQNGTLTLPVTGQAIYPPAIGFSPSSFNVSVNTDQIITRTLLIQNTGLSILNFSLSTRYSRVSLYPLSGTLSSGGQRVISVTFNGKLFAQGNYTDSIYLASNDPANPSPYVAVAMAVVLVAPELPSNPNPQNGEVNVRIDKTLTWQTSSHATAYDVRLWRDGESRPVTPTANISSASYNPPGNLPMGALFHWDVLARNTAGQT